VSYIIHMLIAFPLALVLITEDLILPSLKRGYAPSPVRHLLARHHDVCLWTSLLFTLSICLGGAVQVLTDAISGPTQGIEVIQSVYVTYTGLVLICISYYDRSLGRPRLFALALLATSVLAAIPFGEISSQTEGEDVLQACLTLVNSGSPESAIIGPFNTEGRALNWLNFVLYWLSLACWLMLLRFEKRWRMEKSHRLVSGPEPGDFQF